MRLCAATALLGIPLLALGCGAADFKYANSGAMPEAKVMVDRSASMTEVDAEAAIPEKRVLERKIIYTANVDLVVEEFDGIPSQVEELARQYGGHVARSEIHGTPGMPRSGNWTIRVPVDRYEEFLAAVAELGETRSVQTDSDDITAKYYDVESRIRNKKEEETRLRKHLEDSTGKLEEILAVEQHIARVRGEIESMEGQLRLWKNLTSLTTVTLRVDEIKDYEPEGDPSYMTRVRRAFEGSISALVDTAQAGSIMLVAAVPWLLVLAVFFVVTFFVVRFFVRAINRRRS